MKKAVHIENLTVKYDENVALENINLDVAEGEFLGILGPNGGGKSTLLKSILGLIKPTSGSVVIYDNPVRLGNNHIGYVPQFSSMDKSFPINCVDVVKTALLRDGIHPFYRFSKQQTEFAMEKLKTVEIDKLANRQISELSGGEFQRLLIARSLAVNPKILLLDEPTASVDARSRENIFNLLGELNKTMTVILVTHDLTAVSTNIKKIACLNKTLVYHGEPSLNQKIVTKLYGCPVELIAHGVPHRVLGTHEEGGGCCD